MNRSSESFQPHMGFKNSSVTPIPWLDTSCSVCLCCTSWETNRTRIKGDVPLLCFALCSLPMLCFQISFKLLSNYFCPLDLPSNQNYFVLLLSSLLTGIGRHSEGLKDHFSSLLPHKVSSGTLSN